MQPCSAPPPQRHRSPGRSTSTHPRDEGRSVALGSGGAVYLSGRYWSTVDLGGGPVTSNGLYDAYLVKLAP